MKINRRYQQKWRKRVIIAWRKSEQANGGFGLNSTLVKQPGRHDQSVDTHLLGKTALQ